MNPTVRIDHVVVAVMNLVEASRDYSALGFNVVAGGHHGHAPTRNALIVFGDGTFIELIEWTAHSPGDRWQHILESNGEGLVDFAVTTQDLAGLLTRAKLEDIRMTGPIDGSRRTLDGDDLRWQVGWPASRELPFACCDITPRTMRVPEGKIRSHPNGVTGIDSVVVLVNDAFATLDRYQRLFNIKGERCSVSSTADANIGAVEFGPVQVVLVSDERPARATIGTHIYGNASQRSEGPCALVLTSKNYFTPFFANRAETRGVALRLSSDREPRDSYLKFAL